jgi:outer membrane protein assembly factor BamA
MAGAMKWSLLFLLLCAAFSSAEECDEGRIKVHISDLQFEEAPELTPAIRSAITRELKTKITDYCQLSDEMSDRTLDVLQQHGYFKAIVQDPKWKQIGGRDTDIQVQVLLAFDLGELYRLKSVNFQGQKEFTTQKLRPAIPIKDGDIFNVENMRQGLKNLRDMYCSTGYIDFTPVPNTEIDDEKHLITVTFDMDEGNQYRIGQLTLNGKEPYPGAGKKLMDDWAQHVGEVYDCRLTEKAILLFNDLSNGSLPLQVKPNRETKIVDFDFNFPDPKH